MDKVAGIPQPELKQVFIGMQPGDLKLFIWCYDGYDLAYEWLEKNERSGSYEIRSKFSGLTFENLDDAKYALNVFQDFINDEVKEFNQTDIDALYEENEELKLLVACYIKLINILKRKSSYAWDLVEAQRAKLNSLKTNQNIKETT